MSISVRPMRGQDQRFVAGDRVRAVELGGNLDRQLGVLHRRERGVGVRNGAHEVAAQGHKNLDPAVAHLPDGFHGVHAVLTRRVEAELLAQGVQERRRHLLPDAHGPVALDVAVPADGRGAGAGLADVAAQQQQVDDLLDGGHALLVLRDAHGPGDDHLLGPQVAVRELVDLLGPQARGLQDRCFVQRGQVRLQFLQPLAVLREELVVQHGARGWRPRRRGPAWRPPAAAPCRRRSGPAGTGPPDRCPGPRCP